MPHAIKSFAGFAVVSGTGWLIDVGLTMALVQWGAHPFWASLAGAATAVAFVYVVSLRAIFGVDGRIGARGFPAYVLWQVCAIAAASVAVAALAERLVPLATVAIDRLGAGGAADPLTWAAGSAKAAITPLTLLANFGFMRILTKRL